MEHQRFYVKKLDKNFLDTAIQQSKKLIENDSEIKNVIFLIQTRKSIGWFVHYFTDKEIPKMFIGHKLEKFPFRIKIETLQTYKNTFAPTDLVFAFGLNSDQLLELEYELFHSIKAIIAITDNSKDLRKWINTFPTEYIGDGEDFHVPYQNLSNQIKLELKRLTELINLSTGISYPSDEKSAKTIISELHKSETLDPDTIGSYLIKELKWNPRHSSQIEKLIKQLNNGHKFKGVK